MKKKLLSLVLAVSMILTLAACGGGATPSGGGEADAAPADGGAYTIVVMPKLVGIPYFTMTGDGAKQAGEELGVNVIYNGPTTADAAQQVTMLEDYISQGVDAICVAPNDAAAMTNVLRKAREAGILVLDWDTTADPSLTDCSVHQVNDQHFGEHMVDKLVEYMGTDTGDIALVTGGLSAANLNTWIKASQDYIAANFPNLNIVADPFPTDEKQDVAFSTTKDIMRAYPEVIGILGYSTPTAPGIGEAIRDMGMQNQVTVVANGVEADVQDVLSDGSLDCGNLWKCEDLGYITVAVAKYLLDGNTPADGDVIEGWSEPLIVTNDGHDVYMPDHGSDFELAG